MTGSTLASLLLASLASALGLSRGAADSQVLTLSDAGAVYTLTNQFNGRNTDIQLWKSAPGGGGTYWNQTFDGGQNEYANSLAADSLGNLYVVGAASVDRASDFLLLSYAPNGSFRWVQTYRLNPDESLVLAATDKENNVLVVGSYLLGSHYAIWTAKYNSGGGRLWDRTFEGYDNCYPRNVYVSPLGDVVVTYEEAQQQAFGKLLSTKTLTYSAAGQRTQ